MNDWLRFHPYHEHSQVDYYYLKLCNKLLKTNINEPLLQEMKWSEYKDLTCMLVCWFEDVISETNIWRAFTAEHKRLYGRFLPFFDVDIEPLIMEKSISARFLKHLIDNSLITFDIDNIMDDQTILENLDFSDALLQEGKLF